MNAASVVPTLHEVLSQRAYVCRLLLCRGACCFLPGGLPLPSLEDQAQGRERRRGGGEKVGQMNQGSQSDVEVLQHASHIYNGC